MSYRSATMRRLLVECTLSSCAPTIEAPRKRTDPDDVCLLCDSLRSRASMPQRHAPLAMLPDRRLLLLLLPRRHHHLGQASVSL